MTKPNSMWRIFLAIFAMVGSGTVFAQQATSVPPLDPDTHTFMYREVIPQDGNKDILFDRATEWFRAYYVNPIGVYKVQDKVNGKIEGTARINLYNVLKDETKMVSGTVSYDIKVELRDNKLRYTINNFLLKAVSRYPLEKWLDKKDPAYNEKWDMYLYQVDTTMQRLTKSLKEGMKPKVIKKDEW